MSAERYLPILFPILFVLLLLAGCGENEQLPATAPGVAASDEKIPVTTENVAARAAYFQARALREALQYEESLGFLHEALELDPQFPLANLMAAKMSLSANDFVARLERAEAAADSVSLGEQLLIKSFRAATLGDEETELAMLRKLTALYPGDERAWLALGNVQMERQKFGEAIRHYRRAIDINSGFALAYNMLGYAYRNAGDFESAKSMFKRYVELSPGEPNPYDSYAELLMEAGDYEASIANYRQALAIDPGFFPSRVGIVINESLRGNHEGAIAAAEDLASRAQNPMEQRQALLRLAGAYLHANDIEQALNAAYRMIALADQHGDVKAMAAVREFAGDIHRITGDRNASMQLYREALRMRRDADLQPMAEQNAKRQFLYKAAIAELQDGWTRTAQDYVARFKSASQSASSDYARQKLNEVQGYSALVQEDYDAAVGHLLASNRLSPIVNYFTAVAYRGMGNNPRANEFARRAAFRNTLSPALPFYRGQALALIDATTVSRSARAAETGN